MGGSFDEQNLVAFIMTLWKYAVKLTVLVDKRRLNETIGMKFVTILCVIMCMCLCNIVCRDEEKIMKGCYWPNEVYEPCFGGCAEVSCDNPRHHMRPCYPYCEPGCVCGHPYVRDDRTHQCVLPHQCTATQMGIPVPTKKTVKPPTPPKYNRMMKKDIYGDVQVPMVEFADSEANRPPENRKGSEIPRMGNYFNIVIAPPPIKSLQSRKMMMKSDN